MSDQNRIPPYQHQNKTKKTGGETREKYQLGDFQLIRYQILQ